jgi:hypothetical protein
MRGQIWLVALCVVGVAVGASGAAASPKKPSAPVDVKVESRLVGGGSYEVTLVVTPKRDVKGLVLELDGKSLNVGSLAAGQTKTLTAIVTAGADGKNVAGSAVVDVGGGRRRAAASVRIGRAAKAAPPARLVRMPDGTDAAEVR